jgi:hypothetical protein
MSDHSRRTFLTGTGAAALGAVALTTAGPAAATATTVPAGAATSGAPRAASHEPVVAYVTDVSAGRITVMRGDDEVVVTDRELARHIARQVG